MPKPAHPQRNTGPLGNYLRTHRKKAGLSQRELGRLLGYGNQETTVSRHEQSHTLPPLLIALCYEVLYNAPISQLFPGIHLTAKQVIELRLLEFESELENRSGKGVSAALVAQKLMWLYERRSMNGE